MKKIIIGLLLTCLITSSYANTAVWGLSEQAIKNAPNKANAKILKKAGGAVLTLGAVAGASIYFSQDYIKTHPEEVEYYLEGHPEDIPKLIFFVKKFAWGDEYLYDIGIGDYFANKQDELERTTEWQQAYAVILSQVVAVAEGIREKKNCEDYLVRKAIWNALVSTPDVFEKSYETQLARSFYISQHNTIVHKYDVDSYSVLSKNDVEYDGLQNDHIPSKSAIREYLKRHVNLQRKSSNSLLTETEIKNIYKNTTAISIPNDMHKAGRTFTHKNSPNVISMDSQNLREAMIKDLTNHLIFIKINNPNEIANFFNSAIILYYRNKNLCLFYKG